MSCEWIGLQIDRLSVIHHKFISGQATPGIFIVFTRLDIPAKFLNIPIYVEFLSFQYVAKIYVGWL